MENSLKKMSLFLSVSAKCLATSINKMILISANVTIQENIKQNNLRLAH